MIGLILLSICLVGLLMIAMAIGALVSGRCLRGSCGALGADATARSLACDTCPMRARVPPPGPQGHARRPAGVIPPDQSR